MKPKGIDLTPIYKLRSEFTVIGLTGQTGSGCSDVSAQLVKGFQDGRDFQNPIETFRMEKGFKHNSYRKLRIIYDYAKINFKPFTEIKYKDIITLFILKLKLDNLIDFLKSKELAREFIDSGLPLYDFGEEIRRVSEFAPKVISLAEKLESIDIDKIKENKKWLDLHDFYFGSDFQDISNELHLRLGKNSDSPGNFPAKANSGLSYHKMMQIVAKNLRKSGHPYNSSELNPEKIFTIAETINLIIKSHREKNKGGRSQIVINSLKNPIEIMFFKQRYSAFYAIAINRGPSSLEDKLRGKFTMSDYEKNVVKLLKEEHDGGKESDFYKQDVSACLQQADIHISFMSGQEAATRNTKLEGESTTPYFGWNDQLLKYVSLIDHPGLVTPSPEERCMQLAFTAKHNSGCISRHVGAAITDEHYSVKAIGWNNTPEGQVPCLLRNVDDLLNLNVDVSAFTPYERKDQDFRRALEGNYSAQIAENQDNLKGRNVCICFKCLKNSISEGKNQVHTRSLHAEESAFLQISKYGGVGIKNGKLFSTASPCELCAKKAYQLGIRLIYYIDPYPGISISHILSAGSSPIEVRLFSGAIGNAYHWLYDPIMPYKDELSLLLGQDIQDLTSQYKRELDDQNEQNKQLQMENEQLKSELQKLRN